MTHRPSKLQRLTPFIMIFIAALALLALWRFTPLADYASPQKLAQALEGFDKSPGSMALALAAYSVAALLFFPTTVMTGALVLLYGGVAGAALSLAGALISGVVGFYAGRLIGPQRLKDAFGKKRIDAVLENLKKAEVMAVAAFRIIPAAPYTLANLVFGVAQVSLPAFLAGTLLGYLPAKISLAIFGDSFIELLKNPSGKTVAFAVGALILWIGVGMAMHFSVKRWQAAHG
jgi:phospholipase D1/2